MAVIIHHGPAGSYKTSSAVWFYLLPALRAGRVVVTNVEGMYPLDEIEQLLGEKFPDSAKLWRISSQITENRKLWRVWFNWMPIGALVLLDEAQDIYIKDAKIWKPSDLVHVPADAYSDYLPADLLAHFHEVHKHFKPVMDSASVDDTGRPIVDENGLIIYPPEFTESYMRHRKFNWDVHLCTPDIRKIHSDIRGVAELAISYASKDSFLFTKRKPRLYEHNPLKNGIPSFRDTTYRQKVPVDVHLLYRSTSTGQITKSGADSGPLNTTKGKLVIFVVIPLALLATVYNGYKILSRHSGPPVQTSSDVSQANVSPGQKSDDARSSSSASADSNQVSASRFTRADPSGFVMPHDALKMFWTSSSCKYQGVGKFPLCYQVFELVVGKDRYQIDSDLLLAMGYGVMPAGDCHTVLTDTAHNRLHVYCEPSKRRSDSDDQKFQSPANISAGLIASNDEQPIEETQSQ